MVRPGKLTSPADFRRTYAEGTRASTPTVVAHVRRGNEEQSRVGVTASRGVRGAVLRNRAKRRVREALRQVRPEIRDGLDVVLVAAPKAASADFQDVVNSVRAALQNAGGCR